MPASDSSAAYGGETPHNRYRKKTLYRSRGGWILGVCEGLARYAEISVVWVRLLFIIAVFATWIFPVALAYLMLAIFLRPEPILEPENEGEEEFYNSLSSNRELALKRLRERFEGLERRARRLEHEATEQQSDWDERLRGNKP